MDRKVHNFFLNLQIDSFFRIFVRCKMHYSCTFIIECFKFLNIHFFSAKSKNSFFLQSLRTVKKTKSTCTFFLNVEHTISYNTRNFVALHFQHIIQIPKNMFNLITNITRIEWLHVLRSYLPKMTP